MTRELVAGVVMDFCKKCQDPTLSRKSQAMIGGLAS